MTKNICFTLLLGLALSGCHPKLKNKPEGTSKASPQLEGTWVLDSLNGQHLDEAKLMKGMPVLEIDLKKGGVGGHTGCNSYGGNLKLDEASISFEKLITTKMYCQETPEEEYLDALQRVNRYYFKESKLYLAEAEKVKLVYHKME